MSSLSLVSIVIPVYNRTDKFRGALSSAVAQTYKNIEIIVIDDGSYAKAVSFAMWDILKFQKYDAKVEKDFEKLSRIENIQYIRQENKGAPAARNKGLEMARGDYVIFWDADVVAEPEMLEKMVSTLEKNMDASFVYCNFNLQYKKMTARGFDSAALKQNNYIHTTSLIRKKDAIKWDESLRRFQDWDLWLSMSEQGKKGAWIDENLFYIMGGGTISSWLPKCAYKKPWRWLPWVKSRVAKYEEGRRIVLEKHGISDIGY